MKRSMITVAVLAALAIPSLAWSDPPRPGPYMNLFVGGMAPVKQDVDSTDYFYNESYDDRVEFDPGISVGGAAGYDFGYVRLEVEMAYRYADLSSIRDETSGDSYGSIHGSLGVFSAMANGFIDLHNSSPVTPYFGGGIGVATLDMDDVSGVRKGGTGERVRLYDSGDDTVFAYQIGVGVEIALNPRFSLDLGYRYFGTSSACFDDDDSLLETDMNFESHNGILGLRYRF